jgi:hypothetical protein
MLVEAGAKFIRSPRIRKAEFPGHGRKLIVVRGRDLYGKGVEEEL